MDGSPLVELKNGRVQFKQKSISFEKQSETLQGLGRSSPLIFPVFQLLE